MPNAVAMILVVATERVVVVKDDQKQLISCDFFHELRKELDVRLGTYCQCWLGVHNFGLVATTPQLLDSKSSGSEPQAV